MRSTLRSSVPRPRRPLPTLPTRAARLAALAALVLGAVVLLPRIALALGTVSLSTSQPEEADGRWKLVMTIDYGSIPQIPHIPMIFSFEPKVLYERALTDKSPDKPVLTRIPLQNQQTINEGMDVGFANAQGKVFKVTKFDFVIKRDHGFEAGEYDLKIKREDDGAQLGNVIHLTLKGENTVVDRRAITFAGEKPKKKAEEKKADEAAPEEKKTDEAAPEEKKTDDPNAPPPVPPKQGGCGCRVPGDTAPTGGAALAVIGFAALAMRRRRR